MFGRTQSLSPLVQRTSRPPIERLDVAQLCFADEMPEGRFVDLPGRGTAFVRVAEGPEGAPAVLMVHGLFATADLNWSLAIPALATRFTVVASDLRGHGLGLPTRRFSAEECADDLAAIVKTLELGRVIVVGYSLGGLIAQVFARLHPDLVAGLVLCSTACRFDVPTNEGVVHLLERIARRMPERLRRAALMVVLRPKSADSARGRWLMNQVRRHNTLALLDATSEAATFDSRSWLGEAACRAAVIVPSDDRVVPPAAQRELARTLGQSTVHELAGDHFVCVKRPAEFNAALVGACVGVLE